jgi:hypothetical protein
MSIMLTRHTICPGDDRAEGRLMRFLRLLGERLARPRFLLPDELSPHLLRDIGLLDGQSGGRRPRP